MSRNDAFDALLAIGQSIQPETGKSWGETGRQMKTPEQALCPALFQVEGDCDTKSKLGQLIQRREQVTWVIMLDYGKDQSVVPATRTQDLKDAIDAKFGDSGIGFQTLSGEVYAAYIEGAMRRFPGDLDGIELITVPIVLLMP
jgi:hypothetical protein